MIHWTYIPFSIVLIIWAVYLVKLLRAKGFDGITDAVNILVALGNFIKETGNSIDDICSVEC